MAANAAVDTLVAGCAAHLLEPPANVLRLSLHPDGMAPRIANLAVWRGHVLHRLERQVRVGDDPVLVDLLAELRGYPGGVRTAPGDVASPESPAALVVPLRYRLGEVVLELISTTTVFGVPHDVAVSELAVEAFYPGDAATAAALSAILRPSLLRPSPR